MHDKKPLYDTGRFLKENTQNPAETPESRVICPSWLTHEKERARERNRVSLRGRQSGPCVRALPASWIRSLGNMRSCLSVRDRLSSTAGDPSMRPVARNTHTYRGRGVSLIEALKYHSSRSQACTSHMSPTAKQNTHSNGPTVQYSASTWLEQRGVKHSDHGQNENRHFSENMG